MAMSSILILVLLGAFVLLIILLARLSVLSSTVRQILFRLQILEERLQGFDSPTRADVHQATSAPAPPVIRAGLAREEAPAISLAADQQSAEQVGRKRASEHPLDGSLPHQDRTIPPEIPPAKSRSREEWEELIGGKLLNRIGALALIIGVGLFLKYAFDNNWLSETVRVLMGAAIGAGLLVAAAKFHSRGFDIFAQGLVGAGISILYLTVFASFNFYALVSQPVAFLLMACVTVTAFTQAFRYESLAVSLLGWAGGFLTPFLLSTGQANEIGLFTYVALLNAGLLVISLAIPGWFILRPLSFLGTVVTYLLWYTQDYSTSDLTSTTYILVLLWGLFFAADVVAELRQLAGRQVPERILAFANAVLFQLALFAVLDPGHHSWMGLLTLSIGFMYALMAVFLRQSTDITVGTWSHYVVIAAYVAAIAAIIQFDHEWIVGAWSIEAVALFWIALRFKPVYVGRCAAFLMFTAACVLFMQSLLHPSLLPDRYHILFNERTGGFLAFACSLALGSFLLRNNTEQWALGTREVFDYAWPLTLFVLLFLETHDLFGLLMNKSVQVESLTFLSWLCTAGVWTSYGFVITSLGGRRKSIPLARIGLGSILAGLCVAGIRGFSFVPGTEFFLVFNLRMAILLLCIAEGLAIVVWLRRTNPLVELRSMADSTGIVAMLLILVLITGESRDYFESQIEQQTQSQTYDGSVVQSLQNMEQLVLSGGWLLYSIGVMVIGLWRRLRGLRLLAIAVFGCTILKIFLYDLSFLETLYRIFSFIGLGVILLAASYLYQRNKDIILGNSTLDLGSKEKQGA